MEAATEKSRLTLFHDPVKLRQSLLRRHPLCSSIEPYQGEKPTVYRETFYRSVSEAKWAMQYHRSGTEFDYEGVKTYRPTGSGYKPDFYLPAANFLMEVADFQGRYTADKVAGCKEAATRLGLPVLFVKGFPWFQAEDPLGEITTVFMPGDMDYDDPVVKQAWPQVEAFFQLFKEDDVRELMRQVKNTVFENLDPSTGMPRLEQMLRFRRHKDKVKENLEGLSSHALKLFVLLEQGYPERRFAEIAKDLECTALEAATACHQLAHAHLVRRAADCESMWKALDLNRLEAELAWETEQW